MKYKVVKEYVTYCYGFGINLPVGTILEWFESGGCYTSEAINGYVPFMKKWAVEAWHNYFEKVDVSENS